MSTQSPEPPFESLSAPTTVDLCAERLRERILDRSLAVGSRMPPERQLAAQFGVNRVTVRSALSRLMSEGLLSVRQGRGYEVQDFESESGPTLLPSVLVMARGHSERELAGWVEDMLAARRHLGRAALLELADRQPDTTGVTAALDAFTAAVAAGDSDPRELAALDMDVVRALLEAAGNRVLRLAFNPVLSALAALPELEAQLYAAPHTNVAGYALLRAWLKAPDVTGIEPLIAALAARDRSNVARLTAPRTPAALRKQP